METKEREPAYGKTAERYNACAKLGERVLAAFLDKSIEWTDAELAAQVRSDIIDLGLAKKVRQ